MEEEGAVGEDLKRSFDRHWLLMRFFGCFLWGSGSDLQLIKIFQLEKVRKSVVSDIPYFSLVFSSGVILCYSLYTRGTELSRIH